jgi:hypothetical protein
MASDDFYSYSAKHRLQQINADRAQALANLEQAKAAADYDTASDAVQQIANLDAESRNLHDLHSRYVTSQRAPEAPELTREERFAKPWERMDYGDVWDMVKDHGADPEAFRQGMAEVARRKARGE